jgi:hypothetical protein
MREQGDVHALVDRVDIHLVEYILVPCYSGCGTEVPWSGSATPGFDASFAAEIGGVEGLDHVV